MHHLQEPYRDFCNLSAIVNYLNPGEVAPGLQALWDWGLTHLCRMEFPILMNWIIPFPFWVVGGIFHYYSNFKRNFCLQTVENLIRRRKMHVSGFALFADVPQKGC